MEWLVIAGLAFWVWRQSQRIETLSRKLDLLERGAAPAPAHPQTFTQPQTPPPHETQEPLLLDNPLPPDDDVLVLDTPLPQASNDLDDDSAQDPPLPPIPEAARPAPPPPRPKASLNLEQWLAENGLAWIGGGALALSGILLVAFAAQQDWFTPQVRLICALALGAILLAGSEWVIRRPDSNRLVAALLAGAGVSTLYVTAWGAHALYGYIDWLAAASFLAVASLLLVALSFRHGQPLGVLAIVAALFAPALASLGLWPPASLTLYLCVVGAAGCALAGVQRWAWVALATLAGLYFWFAAAIAADEVRRALVLASVAAVGGVALAFRRPLPMADESRLPWTRAHTLTPAIAICISSIALIWTWLASAPALSGSIAGPAWVGAIFVALAAAAVRARVAPALVFAVAVAALVGGFVAYLRSRLFFGPLSADFYPFILFSSVVIAGSAIGAKPTRHGRSLIAGAGALGAALLTALAASSRAAWHTPSAWAPLFIGAAMLMACAWISARDAQDKSANKAVDFWTLGAVALLLLGVESLFPENIRPAGHASIALTLAAAFAWQSWRGLRWGALAATAFALAHAVGGPLLRSALSGAMPLWQALIVLGLAAGFLACGAYIAARRAPRSATAESLSAGALILVLVGAFLSVRWFAAGGAGMTIDGFTESALRALMLLATAHIAMPRAQQETGAISAARGHVLMVLGFCYALFWCGFTFNPWWGETPARITGPLVVDSIALAFTATAAALFVAANRLYERQLMMARAYAAGGGLFTIMWIVLELRRAFHDAAMPHAPIGVFEAGCYALVALGAAFAIALAARMRAPRGGPLGADLSHIMRGCAWAGMVVAAFVLLISHHPWWGAQNGFDTDTLDSGLAVLTHGAAIVLALLLGRALSVSRAVEPTRFAAAATAILFAWSFGHAAIRWLYHQGGMDDGGPLVHVEGFAHALWPLAFVLLGSAITERAPGRDSVRSYLYDLQAIWGAAIWPALAYAGLGLWALFNPWWGRSPAEVSTPLTAALAVALLIFAAALSMLALRVPHVRQSAWFGRAARIAAVAHLFVAVTLTVRAAFFAGAMMPGVAAGSMEMWMYSAAWALFGATALGFGVMRNDAVLRWCGLIILLLTTIKVLAFDMARLSGVIRAASALALGVVLTLTALAMRRIGRPRDPQELLSAIPSARRDRRRGRR